MRDTPTKLSLFSERSYWYVLYSKGCFDDINFPQDASICNENIDIYFKDLDKRRARILGPAIDHARR